MYSRGQTFVLGGDRLLSTGDRLFYPPAVPPCHARLVQNVAGMPSKQYRQQTLLGHGALLGGGEGEWVGGGENGR